MITTESVIDKKSCLFFFFSFSAVACQNGFWGKHCKNVCNCGGATCNPVSGECMCPPGKMGHYCEQGKVDGNTEIVCGEVKVERSKPKKTQTYRT